MPQRPSLKPVLPRLASTKPPPSGGDAYTDPTVIRAVDPDILAAARGKIPRLRAAPIPREDPGEVQSDPAELAEEADHGLPRPNAEEGAEPTSSGVRMTVSAATNQGDTAESPPQRRAR